jgi:hypothetical protein
MALLQMEGKRLQAQGHQAAVRPPSLTTIMPDMAAALVLGEGLAGMICFYTI